jgi:queuine tRNA-ribosyltransferase
MWDIVDHTVRLMPENKPRYLMGVGSPEDIIEGVARGIDIFDSALPTRVARNGALYTRRGRLNIKRSKYNDVLEPVEKSCQCFTCRNFTAAYLNHLFKCEELLAYRLATIHNLFFMNNLIQDIRTAIGGGSFAEFRSQFLAGYETTDEDRRVDQKLRSVETKRDKRPTDFH